MERGIEHEKLFEVVAGDGCRVCGAPRYVRRAVRGERSYGCCWRRACGVRGRRRVVARREGRTGWRNRRDRDSPVGARGRAASRVRGFVCVSADSHEPCVDGWLNGRKPARPGLAWLAVERHCAWSAARMSARRRQRQPSHDGLFRGAQEGGMSACPARGVLHGCGRVQVLHCAGSANQGIRGATSVPCRMP